MNLNTIGKSTKTKSDKILETLIFAILDVQFKMSNSPETKINQLISMRNSKLLYSIESLINFLSNEYNNYTFFMIIGRFIPVLTE